MPKVRSGSGASLSLWGTGLEFANVTIMSLVLSVRQKYPNLAVIGQVGTGGNSCDNKMLWDFGLSGTGIAPMSGEVLGGSLCNGGVSGVCDEFCKIAT